jgi:hypothetical protein
VSIALFHDPRSKNTMHQLPATGYRLQATGYRLPAISYQLPAANRLLFNRLPHPKITSPETARNQQLAGALIYLTEVH